jgi:hypothetical protein
LTVGPAAGSIRDLFTKVKAIDNKHGKFDLLLCVGDIFGQAQDEDSNSSDVDDLLDGKIEGEYLQYPDSHSYCCRHIVLAPLECYVMQGEYALPPAVIEKFSKTGGELCKNVFLLGL